LKMDAIGLPQTLVPLLLWRLRQHLPSKYWYCTYQTTWCCSPRDCNLKKVQCLKNSDSRNIKGKNLKYCLQIYHRF
jgi:hypothetical protein